MDDLLERARAEFSDPADDLLKQAKNEFGEPEKPAAVKPMSFDDVLGHNRELMQMNVRTAPATVNVDGESVSNQRIAPEYLAKAIAEAKLGMGKGGIGRDLAENTIPWASTLYGRAKTENLQAAHARAAKGEATEQDVQLLAREQLDQKRDEEGGVERAVWKGLVKAPAIIGEAVTGGAALKGLGILARPGVATGIARQVAATPATPGLWLEESQQRAGENGGEWYDAKNVAAPIVKGALQNAIMGHLAGVTGKMPLATRIRAGAIGMPIEQAAADALTTLAEKGLEEAGIEKKFLTQTRYGTVGAFARGEKGEAWKQLASQAALGSVFAGMHGRSVDPVKKLAETADALAKKGFSAPEAANRAQEIMRPTLDEALKDPEPAKPSEKPTETTPEPDAIKRDLPADAEPAARTAAEPEIVAPAKPQEAADPVGSYESRTEAFGKAVEAAGRGEEAHFVGIDTDNMGGLIKHAGREKAEAFEKQALGIVREELAKTGQASLHRGGKDARSDEHTAVVTGPKAAVQEALKRADARIRELADKEGFSDVPRTSQKEGPTRPGLTMFVEPIRKDSRLATVDQEAGFGLENMKQRRASGPKAEPKPAEPTDLTQTPKADVPVAPEGQPVEKMATAVKANFPPPVPPPADPSRPITHRVVDTFRELGGAIAPRLSRLSSEAGNKLARFISAPNAAKVKAPVLIDRVLPERIKNGHDLDTLVGGVLVEMRLRHMRQAYLNESAKATDPAEQAALLKRAQEVGSIIGKPIEKDGDPLASPLAFEQQYQDALKNPDVQAALQRYQQHVAPILDSQFREADGLPANQAIPNFTQIPGMPVNLKAWRSGEVGTGTAVSGNLKNPRARRNPFARQAKGTAEGYDLSLANMIGHSLESYASTAGKVQMYRQLIADGVAEFGPRGQKPEGFRYEIPDAVPHKGLKNLTKPGETSLFFKDEAAMKEVRKALDVDLPWKPVPGSKLLNTAVLASLGEMTAHTKNLMTGAIRPGMSPWRLLKNGWDVLKGKDGVKDRLIELAEIGATKPKGFVSNEFAEGSKLNPLTWTGKFLDFVDQSMRLTADDAFKKLATRQGVQKTEQNRRDFINQLGQYNKKAQNDLVKAARELGIGPFATAGTNFNIQSIRTLFGGHGLKTTSAKADLALRAEMIGRLAAVASVAPLVNYLVNGDVFGDDNTPIGAVKLGEDADGRTRYFDLLGLTGLTRGLRITGVLAMAESARPGAKRAGATIGSGFDKAVEDAFHGLVHPFAGPIVGTSKIALTGENTIGMRVAKHAKKDESQAAYNLLAAFIQANPVVAAIAAGTGLDPMGRKTSTDREVMKQLGPYGLKGASMPPGKPHRTIEIRK